MKTLKAFTFSSTLLLCTSLLGTSAVWAAAQSQPHANYHQGQLSAEYVLHQANFNDDIEEDLEGFALGYSYSLNNNGYWGRFEYLKNGDYDAEYLEFSTGLQANLYNANLVYAVATLGVGVAQISAYPFDDTTYLTLPIGVEVGAYIARNLSIYAGIGYKWNWDSSNNGKTRCNDGTYTSNTGRGACSWHDGVDYYPRYNRYTIGNFDGATYKAGLKYHF